MTKILRINQINPEANLIKEAADVIRNGGTVSFPTETVYGIGADAFNPSACAKIFRAKGRPVDNPLIVHIAKFAQLDEVAREVTGDFLKKAKILWPGPMTFILKKNKKVPDEVTAGLDTVAVRMPAHPIALRLIEQSGTPIAAPSANRSTRPSATKARHVVDDLDGKVDMIIDGGDTAFGLESTIVNMTVIPPMLLRPGAFTLEELERYLGKIDAPGLRTQVKKIGPPIAPGMKYRHYAPDKMVLAVNGKELLVEAAEAISKEGRVVVLCSNEMAGKMRKDVRVIKLGSEANLYEITKNLFDSFRRLDKMDIDTALVQTFPERGIGLALMDRIVKASGNAPISTMAELEKHLVESRIN